MPVMPHDAYPSDDYQKPVSELQPKTPVKALPKPKHKLENHKPAEKIEETVVAAPSSSLKICFSPSPRPSVVKAEPLKVDEKAKAQPKLASIVAEVCMKPPKRRRV